MTRKNDLNNAYKYCLLLKNECIKQEIENSLIGFSLNYIKRIGDNFVCYFSNKNKSTIKLLLGSNFIHLIEQQKDIVKSIMVNEDLFLSKQIVEKRRNGILLVDIIEKFDSASRFKDKNILVDLWENRYSFTIDTIEKIFSDDKYENMKVMYILLKLKLFSFENQIEDLCDFYSKFSTHMNYYISCYGERRLGDSSYSNISYLNEVDVSNLYNKISGADKLYRIYDLYTGIINSRNIEDLNSIRLGILPNQIFDLNGLMGIREKEEALIGKVDDDISKKYVNQLKQMLYRRFKCNREINLDRESILNAITGKKNNSKLINGTFNDNEEVISFKSAYFERNASKKLFRKIFKRK